MEPPSTNIFHVFVQKGGHPSNLFDSIVIEIECDAFCCDQLDLLFDQLANNEKEKKYLLDSSRARFIYIPKPGTGNTHIGNRFS